MRRFAIDLETLGTAADSAILSIGCVEFDETGPVAGFYAPIHLETCLAAGLRMYPSTVLWWMNQSNEARAQVQRCANADDSHPLGTVLVQLSRFIVGEDRYQGWDGEPLDDVEVWGNGADFDNAILQTAYRYCGLTPPWRFWNNRDLRTIRLATELATGLPAPKVLPEIAHDAYADATAQAKTIAECLKLLRLRQPCETPAPEVNTHET